MAPDAVAQRAEGFAAQHLVGAGTRQRNRQMIDDAARPADITTTSSAR